MPGSANLFRIAQISDLHCGGPYFEVSLLERAIGEINELEPDVVVCSGDLTTFGFRHEYLTAREYMDRLNCESIVVVPGNHDSRNVGYVHFEEMFGDRNSVLRKNGVAIVAVDSSEPDLDHGQIGRGRYLWVEEQFGQEPADLKIFVLHHHLLPVPGTGRERNVVYDAGDAIECLQRAGVRLVLSGHKHVPYVWRLEDLFVVNAGTVSSLRLRGNTRPCYNVIEVADRKVDIWRRHPFHGEVKLVSFSLDTLEYAKFTGAIEDEITAGSVCQDPEACPHMSAALRAVALVDGEHYPPVVRDALVELPYDFVAAVLVGGIEKLRGGESYGVPLEESVESALERYRAEVVVDLSDEPVLGPVERFALASRVLAHGVPYVGADFRLEPPALLPFDLPSIAVVGTGKRVGKTAVTGYVARTLSAASHVVVVAMGRGGPPEPETISVPPTVDALVALSRAGRHAASDHLETAAVAGVETVGCRRCGGGLAGAVFVSNVLEGARVAAELTPDLVIFDGSGAALPPIAADRTIVVVGGHQSPAIAAGYLIHFACFSPTSSSSRWRRPDRPGSRPTMPFARSSRRRSRSKRRCCGRGR